MNKKILNFIKVLFISLLLAACSTNSKGVIQYYVDGHLYHEQSFNDFNEIELPDNPTKNNCDFAGWYWDENVWKQPATMQSILNKSLSDPLKLYGKWDVFYNVNFNGKGGVYVSGDTEQRVASGESAVAPVFTKDGYILSWSTSLDNITSNLTIDAVWTAAVYYDVVFDGNGGTLFSSNATQRIAKGDSAVAPDFRKYGYSLGWDKSFSNITSDLNVKAIWTKVIADKYTVTFNPNNGEIILGNTIQEIAKGGSAVAPTLTKIGYELSWDKSFTNITNDIKVNAIWTKKNDVTVTFNGNGGQLLTGEEVQTIKYGADAIVPTYTKTGYFLTWDKSFNKVTNDITVTAIWNSKSSSTMTSLSIGTFIDAAYDSINDKIAVIKTTSLVIYNASNMSVAATFTFLNTPKCLDVDNGRAVVGFGTSNQLQIYDLASNTLFRIVTTTIPVSYLVVDGDMIIYTEYNQHCDLYFYNLISEEIIYMSWGVYQPRLAINRIDHILYVCETGLSTSSLYYYNSQTGEKLYTSGFDDYGFNYNPVYFDGKYVHYYGRVLDKINGGIIVSQNELSKTYSQLDGYTKTILDSYKMSIVKSDTKIALYDNINNKPLYTYSIIIDSARYIKDGKYLLKGVNTLAILNVNGIDGAYVSDPYNQLEKGKVTNEGEGWLSIKKDIYTLSSFDNKYIYLIDSTSYVLQVLDRSTLEAIHNIKLDYKPVCLESHNGYIAIGFGSKEFMRIYNTDDWSFENIQTASKIDSLIVYNDKVIYAESGQHCYVYQYNITSKETIKFGVTSYGFKTYSSVKMSINKDDGILYIGEGASYSSSTLDFYDFNANEYIYQSPFSTYGYVTVPVKCLGKYIKYGGAIVDGRTGVFVSSNGKTRLYNYNLNLIGVKTIYDDNNISVFTASNDGECYTYVYDVINSKIISSINGYFDTAVMIDNNSILLFANGSSIVKSFKF